MWHQFKLAATKWFIRHVKSYDGLFATTSRISCLLHHTTGRSLMRRTLRLRVPALPSPLCLFYVSLGTALFSPRSAATPCQFFPIHQRVHSPTISATPHERHTIPPRPLGGLRLLCSQGNTEFWWRDCWWTPFWCLFWDSSSQEMQLIAVFYQSQDDFTCLPKETVVKQNQQKTGNRNYLLVELSLLQVS